MRHNASIARWHPIALIAPAVLAWSSACAHAAGEPLPKSGAASAHSGWSATGQLKDLGETHAVWTGVYWGTSFNDAGKGLLHKMAWTCPGTTIIYSGSYVHHGYCALTDADGDKIYGTSEAKGPAEGVDLVGVVAYERGTGKYKGIQGSHTFKCSGIGADGQAFCGQEASYKLP
jgi:hypothetical protein